MRYAARLLVALGLSVLTLLLGTSMAWASAPLPSPVPTTPGTYGAAGWSCVSTTDPVTAETSEDCSVTAWAPVVVPEPEPTTSPDPVAVTVVGGPVPVSAPAPLPVVEQSPAPPAALCSGSGSPTAAPSPSEPPATSPPEPPAPEPSPSASSATSPPCVVTATIDQTQWITGGLFAAFALLLALVGFVRREAVGLT